MKLTEPHPLSDIREAGDSGNVHRICSATTIPDTFRPPPPSHLRPLLPLPRYPHRRPLRRSLEHTGPRLRRAQLRQRRGRSVREQAGSERERGEGPARQGNAPTAVLPVRLIHAVFYRFNRTSSLWTPSSSARSRRRRSSPPRSTTRPTCRTRGCRASSACASRARRTRRRTATTARRRAATRRASSTGRRRRRRRRRRCAGRTRA